MFLTYMYVAPLCHQFINMIICLLIHTLYQYLDLVRSSPDYNSITFPHCKCDARKVGHVIVTISLSNLKLKACSIDGELESQEHTFTWDIISNYEADLEEQAFTFQYTKHGKEPRWVRIYSPHVSMLFTSLIPKLSNLFNVCTRVEGEGLYANFTCMN